MGDIDFQKNASDWDISGNNDLMVNKGALRLRGRSDDDNTILCLAAMNIETAQINSDLNASNKGALFIREHAFGDYFHTFSAQIDTGVKKYSDGSVLFVHANAVLRFVPDNNSAQLAPDELTIQGWFRFAAMPTGGRIVSERIPGVTALMRWEIIATNATTWTFSTYDGAGGSDSFTVDVTSLAIDTWYYFRISVSRTNTRARIRIVDESSVEKVSVENDTDVVAIAQITDIYSGSVLQFGAAIFTSATLGTQHAGGSNQDFYLDSFEYFDGELDQTFNAPSAEADIFATQSSAGTVTIDSSADGTEWDMSTFDVDDSNQWSSSVGGNGWDVAYEASDSATPSTYSSWMTLTDLQAESDPTARYMHLKVRCNSDGYSSFYPFRRISVTADAVGLVVTTNSSTLNSVANDGTGTSATLSITPPAAGSYDGTRVYYRLFGATTWTLDGTYVGVQGTAGTYQVTGLSNNNIYEFVAHAFFSTNFSQPSVILNAFVTDNAGTRTEQIIDNIDSLLRSITSTSYEYTIRQTSRFTTPAQIKFTKYPASDIGIDRIDKKDDQDHAVQECTMHVVIGAYVDERKDPAGVLTTVAEDIEKALAIDVTRGGLALDTHVIAIDFDFVDPDLTGYTGWAEIEVDIEYEHDRADPYARP
jgi:hypothetical protein